MMKSVPSCCVHGSWLLSKPVTSVAIAVFVGKLTTNLLVEDMECNNGKDKPYFMDEELMDLMKLKNEEGEGEKSPLVKETSHIQHPRHS